MTVSEWLTDGHDRKECEEVVDNPHGPRHRTRVAGIEEVEGVDVLHVGEGKRSSQGQRQVEAEDERVHHCEPGEEVRLASEAIQG